MLVTITCDNCHTHFQRKSSEVRRIQHRGDNQYCSLSCARSARRGQCKPREPNTVCAWCQTPIYKNPSKLAASKHSVYFCCRKHKDQAQRIGGIEAIMPPHYGTSAINDYRTIATKHHSIRCVECGYDEVPEILLVHHIDYNRRNNNAANLEWRCGRCHDLLHFRTKTGRWRGCV